MAWSPACDSGTDDDNCCPRALVCPSGTVPVSGCEIEECFTVESGCCELLTCVPEASCLQTCLPFERQVEGCTVATEAIYCRSIKGCGTLLYCESQSTCAGVPSCDPGDEASETGMCPNEVTCYEVELCGNTLTCIDSDPLHAVGGAGGGEAGGVGAGGAR